MNFNQETCHKVEVIIEKKDRVMVLNIENLPKPLYRVFLIRDAVIKENPVLSGILQLALTPPPTKISGTHIF